MSDTNFGLDKLYVGPATTDMKFNYKAYDQIARNIQEPITIKIITGYNFKPKKVISNYPATIIIWDDDTKTIVKCNKDDEYDLRTGILLCFMKKLFGNNNNYHKILYDAIDNAELQSDDKEDGTTLAQAWAMYQEYCTTAKEVNV